MNRLFSPKIQCSDKRYSVVRDDPRFLAEKEYVEKLWAMFHPFADASFKSDIAAQFHPKFWEMYLGCALVDAGFDLIPRVTQQGPDLHTILGGQDIWIEATAPGRGKGPDAVPEPAMTLEVLRVPEEQIVLRFTNSLNKKHEKLKEYLSAGIAFPSDAYIVAVNGFDIPLSYSDNDIPHIVKAVLPFGDWQATIDLDRMQVVDQRYGYRGTIRKKSGSPVSTKIFLDPDYSMISGILFSRADLWNRPQSLGSDFLFVHNPLANNPLELGWLQEGRYCWVDGDKLRFAKMN